MEYCKCSAHALSPHERQDSCVPNTSCCNHKPIGDKHCVCECHTAHQSSCCDKETTPGDTCGRKLPCPVHQSSPSKGNDKFLCHDSIHADILLKSYAAGQKAERERILAALKTEDLNNFAGHWVNGFLHAVGVVESLTPNPPTE